jgi:hemolysin activation/secretion protein
MRAVWKTAVCAPLMGMALPLSAWAQLAPPASPPAALRDPAEQLRREQQQRERTPVLRPEVAPATEPKSEVSEELDASFPENLGKPDEPTFAIREIVLSDDVDNRLIDGTDFRRIAAHFEGRRLGVEQINALLNRLTRSLVASGYITSRAAVVEQSIANGTLVVRVQAGRVEEIRYNGHDVAAHDFGLLGVRMALPMAPGDVLRLQDIEQAVDQINRLRRNNAQVQIRPGNQAGGSVVEITNTPGDARSYSLSIDNQGSAGTGLNRIQAGIEQGNALGLMESVSLGLVTSTETNAIFGTFSLPLGYYTLSVMRSWSEYQNLVGDTALVYGTSNSTSLALNRLLTRSQDAKLAMDLSLTKRRSARAINNLELTPQNQAVARIGINRLSRFQTKHGPGQWTFDVGVVRGLSGLGADRDAIDLPEGAARAQFTKVEGNATLQYALGKTWNWRSRLAAQWSRTPLYSSEQLFAGGVSTVRGFAESAVGGDRGVSLRNEWVMQGVPAPFDGRLFGQTLGTEPYLFLDGARLRTVADATNATLLAAGAGLRFAIGKGTGEVIVAKSLKAPETVADTKTRIHVQFGWQF